VADLNLFYTLFYKRAKLEDFVTEILAAAIRDEPQPFLSALRSVHLTSEGSSNEKVRAETQVSVRGAGVIDLVLSLDTSNNDSDPWEDVWVEVKVGSGESGDQFANYTSYIAKQPKYSRPSLITLALSPLRKDIPALTWQDLWDRVGPESSQYWRDLATFLKELGMADEYGRPITPDEIAALPQAVSLFNKAVHILTRVSEKACELWPEGKIPTAKVAIKRRAAQQLKEHGRITVHSTNEFWSIIIFGVAQVETTVDLVVFVVPYDIKAAWVRPSILEQAEKSGLSPKWKRSNDPSDWNILMTREPLQSFKDHDAACTWLVDRFKELQSSGLLNLIPTLGPTGKSEDEGDT
jgi:hypothetical protein